jgi:subtilisin family serine protease
MTRASVAAANESAGALRILHEYRVLSGLKLVEVPEGHVEDIVAAYLRNPDVLNAEPDYSLYLTSFPNEAGTPAAEFDKQWPLRNRRQIIGFEVGTLDADIDANVAWDFWQGDADFRIALIDSGVDYTHPDLAANIWTNEGEIPDNGVDDDDNGYIDDYHGYNARYGSDPEAIRKRDGFDQEGHGTHVAGIIAAVGNNALGVVGVNWRAKIVPIRACAGDACSVSDVVKAVVYCINNDIKLSNESFGRCEDFPSELYNALKSARDTIGHLAVASAGNYAPFTCSSNKNNDESPVWPASFGEDTYIVGEVEYPPLGNVIAVAATLHISRLQCGAWLKWERTCALARSVVCHDACGQGWQTGARRGA